MLFRIGKPILFQCWRDDEVFGAGMRIRGNNLFWSQGGAASYGSSSGSCQLFHRAPAPAPNQHLWFRGSYTCDLPVIRYTLNLARSWRTIIFQHSGLVMGSPLSPVAACLYTYGMARETSFPRDHGRWRDLGPICWWLVCCSAKKSEFGGQA